jgi:hypothetical protein
VTGQGICDKDFSFAVGSFYDFPQSSSHKKARLCPSSNDLRPIGGLAYGAQSTRKLAPVNAPGDQASASRDSFPFTARAVSMVEWV